MGPALEKYLEEGRRNFVDKFWAILDDPFREEFRSGRHFIEAFDRADFFIPLKFSRRQVSHEHWPMLWAEYNKALEQAQKIKRKGWRNPIALEMKLIDTFPGMISKTNAEKFRVMKPSDIAARYVGWKFNSGGVEALQKYFKVFHKPYGYHDFIVSNLAKVKRLRTKSSH
jgi:hypothetical protein